MHKLFLLEIGKNQKKRKENELVSSSLSLSFPPNEEGRCINFLVYGVVFISSPNLNGIFNAVLCLVFLESCSSTGPGTEINVSNSANWSLFSSTRPFLRSKRLPSLVPIGSFVHWYLRLAYLFSQTIILHKQHNSEYVQ